MKFYGLTLLLCPTLLQAAPLTPVHLRVSESSRREQPAPPTLQWRLEAAAGEVAKSQKGYQILAAASASELAKEKGTLWQTELISGSQQQGVAWKGRPLKQGQKVYWKVRVADETGALGAWSQVDSFIYGPPSPLPAVIRTGHFRSSRPKLDALVEADLAELEKRLKAFTAGDAEALGTSLDVWQACRSYLFYFNAAPALRKWLSSVIQSQTASGFYPSATDSAFSGAGYSDATVLTMSAYWWFSGDQPFLLENWESLDRFMVARERADQSFRGRIWGIAAGDTGAGREQRTEREFLDLAFFSLNNRLMKPLTLFGGEPLTSIRYKDFTSRLQKSFLRRYLSEDGTPTLRTQTSAAYLLRSGLLTPEQQAPLLKWLMADLDKNGLQTGTLGTPLLLQVLSLTGQQEKALDLILNADEGTPIPAGVTSSWAMETVAGIGTSSAGFRQLTLRPIPSWGDFTQLDVETTVPSGQLGTSWRQDSPTLTLTLPPGVTADTVIPQFQQKDGTDQQKGLTVISQQSPLRFLAQSGTHTISLTP